MPAAAIEENNAKVSSDDVLHVLQVEGMTCASCALSVTRVLGRQGLRQPSANSATGEVTFLAPGNADLAPAREAIEGIGYRIAAGVAAGESSKHSGSPDFLLIVCIILTVPLLLHMAIAWPLLHKPLVQAALSGPVFFIGWYRFGAGAIRSVRHGVPNMNVLILLGSSAAMVYSIAALVSDGRHGLYFETAAAIITLVMAGNWLEHRTVRATTASIDALAALQPQIARMVQTDSIGKETFVDVESRYVRSGDVLLVSEGEALPVDGKVVWGAGATDEALVTGESTPAAKGIGDPVIGGSTLVAGTLRVAATTVGEAAVLRKIARLVREATAGKPRLQRLADRISAVFVPVVLLLSLLTLLLNLFLLHQPPAESIMRAIAVLVVSCPCAMGLATPAAVSVGLGRAARAGILVKGADTLERLTGIKQVVFDKTGTLTTGRLAISHYEAKGIADDLFKAVVASLESHSSHPIARSLQQAWGAGAESISWKTVTEEKGAGISGTDGNGIEWRFGSAAFTGNGGGDFDLFLNGNGETCGGIRLGDEARPDAAEGIAVLKKAGLRVILLSGDSKQKCEVLARSLGIDEVYAAQSPAGKLDTLRALQKSAPTAMVGDGINDAPALAAATIGISLSEASDIARQSADLILTRGRIADVGKALRLGVITNSTIRQNLFWAFIYNVAAIPVAALGYLSPVWGAALMGLSDVALLLNALRLRYRRL